MTELDTGPPIKVNWKLAYFWSERKTVLDLKRNLKTSFIFHFSTSVLVTEFYQNQPVMVLFKTIISIFGFVAY
jgi:hypothetical protein